MASPFIATLLESFACQLIGFTISTTIYGITVLQTYFYFRTYPNDKLYIKLTVGALWILDTLGTILVAHSLYTYFVLNFTDPLKDANLVWSFSLENGVTTLITFVVQCYFAECLWRFSHGNRILVGSIAILALASFGLGIETTAHLFIVKSVLSLASNEVLIIGGLVQGFAALCDILITGGLCYYLHNGRSGLTSTDSLVDKLMVFAINRGALTTIIQTCFLVTNVAMPGRYFWLPFHMIVSKLYVNALLATLNVRMSLTDKHGFAEVEMNHTSIVFNSPSKAGTFPASTTMSEGSSGTLDGAASAKKGHAIDTCYEDIGSAA